MCLLAAGGSWSLLNASAFAGTTRYGAAAAVSPITGDVFVMGGNTGSSGSSDVFVSRNVGLSWQRASYSTADWSGRYYLSAVFLNADLFVMGGTANGVSGLGDCWRCAGGNCSSWTRMTPAGFNGRHSSAAVAFQNKMLIIGGLAASSPHGDIWQSGDGSNWTKIVSSTPFAPRYGHSVVQLRNKLYLMGGSTGASQYSSEVWSSTDASTLQLPSVSLADPNVLFVDELLSELDAGGHSPATRESSLLRGLLLRLRSVGGGG